MKPMAKAKLATKKGALEELFAVSISEKEIVNWKFRTTLNDVFFLQKYATNQAKLVLAMGN